MSWAPPGPPQPPPQPVPPPMPVAFSGSRNEFFRLVARGAALELVTVGFYRFWLTTDIRRHLWSNTLIDGDGPEYTGRGKELLIGFLVALAILVPVYLGYALLAIEAEHGQTFASLPMVAFFYLFGQFAIYRARRYRLTRTVWRGVRFWMSGSGWIYALKASLWGLLVVITLGLALPWREAALERYKMRHSYYGDLQGSFEGRGWDFFKRGWWLWLLMPFALVTVFGPFAYAAFKAIEWRWWLSGIRFGEVRLESTMRRSALIGLYWKVIGWAMLLGTVFSAYLVLCIFLAASIDGSSIADFFRTEAFARSIPLMVLLGIGYLALVLAMNVVMRVYLMRDLWVRVLSSTIVHNIEAAANVTARGELANALGEGFADGLDVAGF
ncbi:DUF898 family protein [Bradyrhizobium sp. Pear77]|uniref:DUF898 domain-containing protein n=1 Tax=Bradyrhizobium altum TaxID=1571202 RepID=UPI001E292815|nr:DUF898 domain-containing protein [Bradyrhizobium altum]MCC8957136.1 DUF898 family protein [Bradyrhizobium altum]